jgi:hypothetical protein
LLRDNKISGPAECQGVQNVEMMKVDAWKPLIEDRQLVRVQMCVRANRVDMWVSWKTSWIWPYDYYYYYYCVYSSLG